jgi:hypothetical protein
MAIKEFSYNMYEMTIGRLVRDISHGKYVKEMIIIFVIIIGFFGGTYLYRLWNVSNERIAQKAFMECLHEYQRVLAGSEEGWQEVAMVCELGYQKYKSAYIAPFFLAVQADALIMDGKQDQALTIMNQMINALLPSNKLIELYKTKRALIKLDSEDTALQQEGREELSNLAYDAGNIYADQAYYYLGYDHWIHDRIEQARLVWQQLIERFTIDDRRAQSVWVAFAQEKLQHIQ